MEQTTHQKSANQPKPESQHDELTEKIIKQILTVRDTGKTNMFSINNVQRIAYDLDLFELVNFLEERKNHKVYCEFILHGKKEKTDRN